jgi:hypothetical protein
MTIPVLASRIPRIAAKRRLAASSVAPVASGYECSPVYLNADAYRFSRPVNAICSDGDLT